MRNCAARPEGKGHLLRAGGVSGRKPQRRQGGRLGAAPQSLSVGHGRGEPRPLPPRGQPRRAACAGACVSWRPGRAAQAAGGRGRGGQRRRICGYENLLRRILRGGVCSPQIEGIVMLFLRKSSNRNSRYLMPASGRFQVALVSGKGATAVDTEGKPYIDFGAGIGVNALGYCDPDWVEAVCGQAAALQHISNLYYNPVMTQLAETLCKQTPASPRSSLQTPARRPTSARSSWRASTASRRMGRAQPDRHPEQFVPSAAR